MSLDWIMEKARENEGELLRHERFLRMHPEVGFELKETLGYIESVLASLGLQPLRCGRAGIIACIYGERDGEVFLLRADCDALSLIDERGEEHIIHACGHHMHTAMLLGAAKILAESRDKFCGCVKLMFQGAEEILSGAKDMIENGALESPTPSAGMTLHVMSGVPLEVGSVVLPTRERGAPAATFFEVSVKGKGAHGAMPQMGADALISAAHIVCALNVLSSREVGLDTGFLLTIGSMQSGRSANAIAETAYLSGSLRSFDEDLCERMQMRVGELCRCVAQGFRTEAEISFTHGTPVLYTDIELCNREAKALRAVLGEKSVMPEDELEWLSLVGGSEDFAYVSREIPTFALAISAGNIEDGYTAPLHNPGVKFDTRVLSAGAAAYVTCAINFLNVK